MFLEVISKWKSIRLVLLESLGVGVQSFSVCVDSLSCLAHYESEIENVGFDVLMEAVLNGRLVRLFFQRVQFFCVHKFLLDRFAVGLCDFFTLMFLTFPMGLVCSKASLVQFDRFSGSSSSHKACSMTFCISKRMSAVSS